MTSPYCDSVDISLKFQDTKVQGH